MSAENNQSPRTPPPYSPTTSQHSTQTSPSEEEDAKVKLSVENKEGPLLPKEDKYLRQYKYLYEKNYRKKYKDLEEMKKEYLEGYEYLYEDLYSEVVETNMSHSSQIQPDLKPRDASYFVQQTHTLSSQDNMKLWKDKSTQTEWIHESVMALESKSKEQESPILLSKIQSDLEACIQSELSETKEYELDPISSISEENFWDIILHDPIETLESKDFSKNKDSTYKALFRTVVQEIQAYNELGEDIGIPLTAQLESEDRKKLRVLFKKNFEDYKEIILWLFRRRQKLCKCIENTITFQLSNKSLSMEKAEDSETEVKKTHRQHKKKLEIETEGIDNKYKVQHDDGIILYPSKEVFQVIFSDGSGQIHYPSGNLALLILTTKERKFTYIILEDNKEQNVRALINTNGHATFYDENEKIWLSLSQNLGYYFPKDKPQKVWNWWNLNIHVHAPPVRSISLEINKYIKVQVRSQDNIMFCFTHQEQKIYFNLGTKYKFIPPEILSEMKMKTILEVEIDSTTWKIQVLLEKISKILNILTITDLENFIEITRILLVKDRNLKKEWNVLSMTWSKDFSSNQWMAQHEQSSEAQVF